VECRDGDVALMSATVSRSLGTALLLFAAALAPGSAGCRNAAKGCTAEPYGYVNTFFRSENPKSITATVVSIRSLSAGSAREIVFADSAGADTLYLDAAGLEVPLEAGSRYSCEVEYVPGFPSLSGVIVRDDRGLVFAGVTDRVPASRVFVSGIPGFSATLEDGGCPDRNRDSCYDAVHNMELAVTHAGVQVRLKNREAARLGDYVVTCLAAQRIDYNASCADAGAPSYSFVIARSDTTAAGHE